MEVKSQFRGKNQLISIWEVVKEGGSKVFYINFWNEFIILSF